MELVLYLFIHARNTRPSNMNSAAETGREGGIHLKISKDDCLLQNEKKKK